MPEFLDFLFAYLLNPSGYTLLMGICLYWVPFFMCAAFFIGDEFRTYQNDKQERDAGGVYIPRLTVGTIVADIFITVIPVANLWMALFKVFPRWFSGLFKLLERVLDQPLVPGRKK